MSRNFVEKNLAWDINKGQISMLWDPWLSTGVLGAKVEGVQDQWLAYYIHGESWNINLIREDFEENIATQIISHPLCAATNRSDRMIWKPTSNGVFTLASAYEKIRKKKSKTQVNVSIWVKNTPIKVSFFMSNLFRFKLPIDSVLYKFGINGPSRCFCCVYPSEETFQHIFSEGDLSKEIWKHFEQPLGMWKPKNEWRQRCHQMWTVQRVNKPITVCLHLLPSFICWNIWKARNSCKFQEEKKCTVFNSRYCF